MKGIVTSFIAIILCLGLCACGEQTQNPASSKNTKTVYLETYYCYNDISRSVRYDDEGKIVEASVDFGGNLVEFSYEYNENGTIHRVHVPSEEESYFEAHYNDGLLVRYSLGEESEFFQCQYDENGKATSVMMHSEEEEGHIERLMLKYHSNGILAEMTNPKGGLLGNQVETVQYNSNGQIESYNGGMTKYEYDSQNRLVTAKLAGQKYQFCYDANGKMNRYTRNDQAETVGIWDEATQTMSFTAVDGVRLVFQYDDAGQPVHIKATNQDGVVCGEIQYTALQVPADYSVPNITEPKYLLSCAFSVQYAFLGEYCGANSGNSFPAHVFVPQQPASEN